MSQMPLPLSVEIARELTTPNGPAGVVMVRCVDDAQGGIAAVVDVRLRPLVDLLRECRPYIDDYQGSLLHSGGDPCRTLLGSIDAALKAAGAECQS